jgi:hypothetical protein
MIKSIFMVMLMIMFSVVCDRSYANDWVSYNSFPQPAQPLLFPVNTVQTQYVNTVQTVFIPVQTIVPVPVPVVYYPIVRYVEVIPNYTPIRLYSYRRCCINFNY